MQVRDWNAGGPGLPFYLPGAVSAQSLEPDAAGLVARVGTRKHGRLVELVGSYREDGHEPEIWHGRQLVSTGEGTLRVPFLLVRCRRCDHRTLVRRFLRPGGTYDPGECEPLTVDEIEGRERRRVQRGTVVGLRVLAGVAVLFGVAAIGATLDLGPHPARIVVAVCALLLPATFLVGARERGRPLPPGRDVRPWWSTSWGRATGGLVVTAVVAVVVAPGAPVPHLRIDAAGDPTHPAAQGCAIVAEGSTVEALGVSVPAASLGGPTGSGPGRFLEEDDGTFGCWGAAETGVLVVSLTCVGTDVHLRREIGTGDGAIALDDGPATPPGVQSATWTAARTGGRGVLVERDGILVQLGAWGGASADGVGEDVVMQAIALLDYVSTAAHVACVAG